MAPAFLTTFLGVMEFAKTKSLQESQQKIKQV